MACFRHLWAPRHVNPRIQDLWTAHYEPVKRMPFAESLTICPGAFPIPGKLHLCRFHIAVNLPYPHIFYACRTVLHKCRHIFWRIPQKQPNFMWECFTSIQPPYQLYNAPIHIANRIAFYPQYFFCFMVPEIFFQLPRTVHIQQYPVFHSFYWKQPDPVWNKAAV